MHQESPGSLSTEGVQVGADQRAGLGLRQASSHVLPRRGQVVLGTYRARNDVASRGLVGIFGNVP